MANEQLREKHDAPERYSHTHTQLKKRDNEDVGKLQRFNYLYFE